MVNIVDDIARQAREGSVAAIIQILNDQLAEIGVRTRAVFADGVLQLLCEAATADLLEQSSLVDRLTQILEQLSPQNIRRVQINSRLVREHQLLWLEEISRDPENQLLWSQEIKLRRVYFWQRFAIDQKERQGHKPALPKMTTHHRLSMQEPRQFQRGIIGGVSLSLLLLIALVAIYKALNSPSPNSTVATTQAVTTPIRPPSPQKIAQVNSDSFAQAVRLAEQAATEGKTAQSREDWLVVAAKWQQASDLMATVPSKHPRYTTAANRTALYDQNSKKAQQEAQKK
ncbi:MAG: hypothetical protein EAZ09_25245 [Oscillatoriales cyanobacterium]|nr:MAG: hypothetical protein EAZ18_21480 [Oscillatoriales cyanobacterium]TAH15104.1 MAG: hypothetical protein EAZ09_25245 [Oscillatoriales cyanobacterium]